MNSVPRPLVFAAILGGFIVMTPLDNDGIVSAQPHATIVATRLYTGPDGQTHSEKIEVTQVTVAGGVERSDLFPATGLQFVSLPAAHQLDWHTAPRRQYVITLSGRGEIELTGGQKILAEPGGVFLAEDLTGKGHISRTLGAQDWITAQVPLADK